MLTKRSRFPVPHWVFDGVKLRGSTPRQRRKTEEAACAPRGPRRVALVTDRGEEKK